MWNRLRRWLGDIPIPDPLARRQAILVQSMLIGVSMIALITLPIPFTAPAKLADKLFDATTTLLIGVATALILIILRRGRFQQAIMLAILGLLLGLAVISARLGLQGNGAVLLGFALPILLAGLLAGRRSLWLVVGLSGALVVGIALLEQFSSRQSATIPAPNPLVLASDFVLIILVLGLFLERLGTSLREALANAAAREEELKSIRVELEQHTAALSAANQELKREVAERRRAVQALRESEERYRLITENSRDLISLLDLEGEGQWIYISPSYRVMLGYDPADLIGPLQLEIVHPDDRDNVIEQYDRLAAGEDVQITYRMRHADGSWRWIELQATAIRQQGNSYAVTVGRDITDRQHLEAQLMQSQRLESIGRLAGGVAHDFNNLLTAILGNTELALDGLPAAHPVRADLNEIAKSAERATMLTRQLLAFARKQVIEPRVIDLNQLILDMDKLLRRLIGEHIELITLAAPGLWRVRADPGQIEQVVINLAINARDAMPNGGKLTIETENILLDHDYAHRHISVVPGHYVLLAISDTGTGMDEEIQGRIFEPFFTTKESGRGTGLGLATCYGIIKQHGGNIWPYSEPGHGSTFKIYLPRVEAPAEQPPPAETDAMPRGHETVLLAEDEPSVRMLAARILRAQGYTVLEAANGDEALALAHPQSGAPIDLLLTDVVMPQMSGKALAERLKALYPRIGVLFISGYTDNAIVHHGQLDPGIVLLQKPFSPSALAHKVRDVLDGRNS